MIKVGQKVTVMRDVYPSTIETSCHPEKSGIVTKVLKNMTFTTKRDNERVRRESHKISYLVLWQGHTIFCSPKELKPIFDKISI